jgi:hypothetical protein
MKKFTFPLDRVLTWRTAQVRLEQMQLERLYMEARTLDAHQSGLKHQLAQESAHTLAPQTTGISGLELAALDQFRKCVAAEITRIEKAKADCRARIEAQIAVIVNKRRDAKLLENLREKRLTAWHTDLAKEIDQLAEEIHVAKWKRVK